MSTPSLAILTRLRAQVTARLPDTASIQTNTPARDGRGGQSESWATTGIVACKLFKSSGGEAVEGGKMSAIGTWAIRLPWGTAVTPQHRLVVGGHVYEVLATDSDRTDALSLHCDCKRVD